MYVILDSTILVSIAINTLKPIAQAWRQGVFIVLVSKEMLSELREVLYRDKFRRWLTLENTEDFLQELVFLTESIEIQQPFPEFDDPKDRYILAMLEDDTAELLVTSDKALLRLYSHAGKAIVHPSDFVSLYLLE